MGGGGAVMGIPEPVLRGARRAVERLAEHEIDVDVTGVREAARLAEHVILEEVGRGAPDAAVELMVENVAVAAGVRQVRNEEPLSHEDVSRFVQLGRWFFNSLWHDDL